MGAYERLTGRAHFAVDPAAPAQRGITDTDKASVDRDELVCFVGDFSILKPVDPGRGNRRIFFDYGNRGNKRCCNSSTMRRPRTVQAPLGTYCGWNLRARGFGHGAMHEFSGSYIPLAETPEERRMTGDPRQSIIERYSNRQAYVAAIVEAARQLVADGLMLEEDVERAAAAAADWGRPRHDIGLK